MNNNFITINLNKLKKLYKEASEEEQKVYTKLLIDNLENNECININKNTNDIKNI